MSILSEPLRVLKGVTEFLPFRSSLCVDKLWLFDTGGIPSSGFLSLFVFCVRNEGTSQDLSSL